MPGPQLDPNKVEPFTEGYREKARPTLWDVIAEKIRPKPNPAQTMLQWYELVRRGSTDGEKWWKDRLAKTGLSPQELLAKDQEFVLSKANWDATYSVSTMPKMLGKWIGGGK